MTHARLVSTVALETGESRRTLERFGVWHKLRRNVPHDDSVTVMDCPCCGGTVVLAWHRLDPLPEFGDCRRCETVFPYTLDEVYDSDLLDVVVLERRSHAPAA